MSAIPKQGEHAGRRWKLLFLAGAVGFVGRGGVSAGPATVVMLLLALFVAVFIVALAFSMLHGSPAIEVAAEDADYRPAYSDPAPVQHEAVYGSP